MMKRSLLAGLIAMAMVSGAKADSPAFNWSGFYVGGHLGWGAMQNSYLGISSFTASTPWLDYSEGDRFSRSGNGVIGGIQLGYNWQVARNVVVGVEASLSGSGMSHWFRSPVGIEDDEYRTTLPLFGSLTGRVGFAADRVLVYAKGGLAIGQVRLSLEDFAPPVVGGFRQSSTRVGWTIGAGIEYALAPRWTLGLEYNYADYGSFNASSGNDDILRVSTRTHAVTVRANYLFSTGPGAPTRY
jgi:outer membrane immunogenic protein